MPENEGVGGTPDRSIEAADISPNGKTLITGSLDGRLAEWDMETGARRRVLFGPRRLADEDSRFFAVKDGQEADFPFYFSRLGEPMAGSSLLSVRFSADGRFFAVGAANGYVVLWRARSRREILGWWASTEAGVVALDISPGRKWVATGSLEEFGKPFRVWRLRGLIPDVRQAFCGEHHILGVWAVCFSPNGRLVAEGGWTMSGYNAPELYDVKSGRPVAMLYWDVTRALRFSPNGKLILTGGDFGDVKLWEVKTKEPVCEFKAHGDPVRAVGFSPDGKRFFSASRTEGVKIWETKDEERLIREFPIGRALACRFTRNGRTLLAASAVKGSDRPDVHRLPLAP